MPKPSGSPWVPLLLTLGGVAALAAGVLSIDPLREALGDAVSGDTATLRHDLRGLGAGGVAIVVALALAHSVIWYPTEILDAAVGFVYGFWVGLPLLMALWLLNGVVCYFVGRHAARPLLERWLGSERLASYEAAVHRGGITLLIGMRLIPIFPFSLFSYAAGSARVPLRRFLWTTAVGYVPLTAAFAFFGSRLEKLSADDPLLWGAAAVFIGLLLISRRIARAIGLASEA